MDKRDLLAAMAGCLALSLALNWQGLHSLLMDMDSLNAVAVFYLGPVDLWRMLRWLTASNGIFSSYEPLTNLSYWGVYGLLKAKGPEGFRWLAVVLQAAASLLVGLAATRWVERRRWAVLAGLLYLLHPMHGNWSCMAIPHYWATVFILAGFLLHSGSWDGHAGWKTAGLCAAGLLAAFSKESGVLFPLFLLCFDALASRSEPSAAKYWRKRLVPYLGLLAVGLFYAWVRIDLLHAHAGPAVDAGRRLWEALRASRMAWTLPLALPLALAAGKKDASVYLSRVVFCGAWFALGIVIFLGLLPIKVPDHVQSIDARYLLLPMAGLAWGAALAVDRCARRWGDAWALLPAVLVLAPVLPGPGRFLGDRPRQLALIEQGLALCADSAGTSASCVQAAISLPLVREREPEAFARLQRALEAAWTRPRAEAFLEFYARDSLDGFDPKWRCLVQSMLEKGELEDCIEAQRSFAAGAFEAAASAWPSYTEALFQQARASALKGDAGAAAQSYDRALRSPMAYYLLGPLTQRLCGLPRDKSCRFLERTDLDEDIDLFRATGQTWLGPPPPRPALPLETLQRWTQRKPRDIDLWLDLAAAASARGERALAREALARAESLSPDRQRAERLARLCQDSQDYDSTLRVLGGLVRDFPFDPRYWNDRAVARLLLKDEAGALGDLEEAIRLDPNLLSAYLTMGGVQAARGRKDLALKTYQKALRCPVKRGEPAEVRRMLAALSSAQ